MNMKKRMMLTLPNFWGSLIKNLFASESDSPPIYQYEKNKAFLFRENNSGILEKKRRHLVSIKNDNSRKKDETNSR